MSTPSISLLSAIVTLLAATTARADHSSANRAAYARVIAAEPGIAAVRRAAVEHAGLSRTHSAGWARRARWSATLPRLSLSASRKSQVEDQLLYTTTKRRDLETDIDFEARATWDLNRIVFDPVEIRVATEQRARSRARNALRAQVTALYYRRRRLQMRLAFDTVPGSADALATALDVEELTAQLDGLTGGRMSKR